MVNKTQYDEIELQKKAPSDRIRNSCEDDTSPESSDSDDSSNDSSDSRSGAPLNMLLPIVLVKKSIKCLKQCSFFAKKSAKIMLIF